MGSKPKFWYEDAQHGRCLFKLTRPETGEDWAEKVAAELAEMLGLPHAVVELATWRGQRGVISPSFVPRDGWLLHGNELLSQVVPDYPSPAAPGRFCRVPQHTLSAVLRVVASPDIDLPAGWTAPSGVDSALAVFVGYLMFDAWIGNTDRHHENWAFVLVPEARASALGRLRLHLAPTYDHASSLGRNEPDSRRTARLHGNDPQFTVAAYVQKCRSALYAREADNQPLTVSSAFAQVARLYPDAARVWLKRLKNIGAQHTGAILERVPEPRMTYLARDFALGMLSTARARLLELGAAL